MERPILPAMDMDYLYHAGNARLIRMSWYTNQSETNRKKIMRIDKLTIDGQMVFDVAFQLSNMADVTVIRSEGEFDAAIVGLSAVRNFTEHFGLKLGWDRDGYYSSSVGIKVSKTTLDVLTIDFGGTRYKPSILVRTSKSNSYHEAYDYNESAYIDRMMSYQDLDFTVESYNDQPYSYVKGIPEAYFINRNSSNTYELF